MGMILYKRPNRKSFWIVSSIIVVLVLLSVFLTWLPYFRNVSLNQILQESQIKADPVSSFPLPFKQANLKILSFPTQILLKLMDVIYVVQIVFALAVLLYVFLQRLFKNRSLKNFEWKPDLSLVQIVVLSGAFVLFSYAFSALLGGADWLHNQRPDQTVQFLPMFLLMIFLFPLSMSTSGKAEKIIHGTSIVLLAIFAAVNLLCGFMIIRDHLQYRGKALTDADVPLTDKMQVVDFIASDWKRHSTSNVIPVDYDLSGRWDWVPKVGSRLAKWYPAPMTQGRSFDYELLRRYGLTNQQEGAQHRTFGKGRYLVTYAFEAPPQIENAKITNYIFGRLRVSVVEKQK
jgi:hypothetical protein